MRQLWVGLFLLAGVAAGQWKPLFNGRNLDGWESIGDGKWSVMQPGIIVGDRVPKSRHQAWLYTREEFGDYDLRLEYWTRLGGNSGVSIRDQTRAKYAVAQDYDAKRTPSHNGYEIQISGGHADKYPTGSVYLFAEAKKGFDKPGDWNLLEISSRKDMIRVKLNGTLVCEHPGDPNRPKQGPIGLQLHDAGSVAMFRNVQIRQQRSAP